VTAPGVVGRLSRLAAELEACLADVARLAETCIELPGRFAEREPDVVELNGCGKALHDLYLAVERVLERTAKELGGIPAGASWHADLLRGAALDVSGVRPPVLRPETVTALEPLLRFRHRYRNLYFFDLDWDQIHPHLSRAAEVARCVEEDVTEFCRGLRALDRLLDKGT